MRTRHKKTQNGSAKRREELLQVRVASAEKKAFEAAAGLRGSRCRPAQERPPNAADAEAAGPVAFLPGARG
jgi:hypothetical protein